MAVLNNSKVIKNISTTVISAIITALVFLFSLFKNILLFIKH